MEPTSSIADASSASDADRLVEFLRDRDMPCPQCEYNLRNLQSPICPECGQALQLAVTLVEPYLKAWIALLAAMCAGGGLGILWIIASIGEGPPPPRFFVPIMMNVAMIPAAWIVLHTRRRFLRAPRHVQWRRAAIGLGAFILSLVLISLSFRR